ncbi:hypothetical protein SRABI89_05048 [Pseudomonas koreensis]|nr:hypothetical protein SRABI89_05048 [Pseudomonas koreensis]
MKTRELTHARLLEKLHYDPETGRFTRRPPNHKRRIGQFDKNGYITIAVDRVKHQAHRLAWLYMTGEHPDEDLHVDHINRIRDDNRWINLRQATPADNCNNREYGGGGNSTGRGASGIHGVYWDGRKERWHVQMQCRGKYFYGGYHSTLESARVDADAVRAKLTAYIASVKSAA